MIIGVPKEIKTQEHRVGLVPSSVKEMKAQGHHILVEHNAGAGINFSDADYIAAGATICDTAAEIFSKSDMIVKVKEPQPQECKMLRPGQILFTYLHLAADPEQAHELMKSGAICIAYETVTGTKGGLPLLAPMSEIAGRLSVLEGTHYLQKHLGGTGRLLPGVPGVGSAKVIILGGGVAGYNAARMAVGMEAEVTIFEKSQERIRFLDDYFGNRARVLYFNQHSVEQALIKADLVIGAVLIPGAAAPKLISRDMLKTMQPGSVIVDIAIDQGGCIETSKPTTHVDPIYTVEGVIHYCVANMPGAVALTSALHLNNAVLPYAMALADKGWKQALTDDPHLRNGLNVLHGGITHEAVAQAINLPYTPAIF